MLEDALPKTLATHFSYNRQYPNLSNWRKSSESCRTVKLELIVLYNCLCVPNGREALHVADALGQQGRDVSSPSASGEGVLSQHGCGQESTWYLYSVAYVQCKGLYFLPHSLSEPNRNSMQCWYNSYWDLAIAYTIRSRILE